MPKPLPTFDGSVCPSCVHRDQFRRHLHFLKDFRTRPDLEKHLTWSLPASRKGREFHEDQLVGILQWVESIQQLYEKQSDTNGTPLEAWEAWCMQQARQTIPTKAALHHRLRELGMPTGWMLETVAVAPDEDGDMEETTVERGDYRSVRAAAKAAGIVKETTRFAHLCHHWTKASPEDRAQFLQWLQTQQDT